MITKLCSNKSRCCHIDGPELSLDEFSRRAKAPDGLQYRCKTCVKSYRKQWYQDNSEYNSTYYKNNKKKIATRSNQWGLNNPEKRKVISKKYRVNNLEKTKAAIKNWSTNNPGKINAKSAKRRAAKIQRTPKWLTKEDHKRMQKKYEMASLMSEFLGVEYHVDHRIPLQGKTVSGFHCPDNLQIMLASDNLSKSNKF